MSSIGGGGGGWGCVDIFWNSPLNNQPLTCLYEEVGEELLTPAHYMDIILIQFLMMSRMVKMKLVL